VHQRRFAGVGLPREHAFTEEGAADRHAIKAAHELVIDPRLDAVRGAAFMQFHVEGADIGIDPSVFAVLAGGRAPIDHRVEVAIDGEAELVLPQRAREAAGDVKGVQRKNAAPFRVDDKETVIIAALRHRKDAAFVAGQQVVG
jgi:hypothetical protein